MIQEQAEQGTSSRRNTSTTSLLDRHHHRNKDQKNEHLTPESLAGTPTNLEGSNKRSKAQIDRQFRPIRDQAMRKRIRVPCPSSPGRDDPNPRACGARSEKETLIMPLPLTVILKISILLFTNSYLLFYFNFFNILILSFDINIIFFFFF